RAQFVQFLDSLSSRLNLLSARAAIVAAEEGFMQTGYTYASALAASQRINWKVEDIIGGDKRLDFDKPFMPDALARTATLDLPAREKLLLNQLRGNGYLYLFGLV